MSNIANTPSPPYYAVIFTSKTSENLEGYDSTSQKMLELVSQQRGFLGVESARNDIGITVSYWRDMDAIAAWRNILEHQKAQSKGKATWYSDYTVRICKVEREYSKP